MLCNGEFDKPLGNLLYHIATRYKGPDGRVSMLVGYVCAKKLTTEPQTTGPFSTKVINDEILARV